MDSAAQETMRETIIKTGKLERVNAISQRFDFDAAEIIATGAFGQIMSPKENREIVIKTARRVQDASNKTPDELRLAQIDYKEGQRALVNESVFTMLCAHPHIACFKRVINDFGADELYCVMDRLDMRLDDYLLSKTIHGNGHPHHLRRNKRKICMDLARGVHYLHAHMHIIHRDLKHNNVMLWFGANGMPTAVIIDLGLAVKMDALKRTDRLSLNKYTVMYRPPELVWGDRSYSFAADIWALACMFWEIYHVPDSMFARKSVIEQYLFYLPKDDVMCLAQLHATHLGAPDIRQWPEVVNLRHYAPIMAVFSEFDFTGVRNPRVDDIAQLFAGMLQYNPARRPDAARVCASLEATYAEEKFVSV
jgi:serine/threonine protein kinase